MVDTTKPRDVPINHTGRYWYPFIRDVLAARDGYGLRLYADAMGCRFADYDRTQLPYAGLPHLFTFPGPYHPLEVVAAARGFGSVYGGGKLGWWIREIDRTRSSYSRFVDVVSEYLYWPRATVHVMYHLLTPVNTNYRPADPTPGLRGLLYCQLRVGATNAALACREAKQSASPITPFWGGTVSGEVEL